MNRITIGTRDNRVIVFNPDARLALGFSWRAAVEIAHAIMWKARGVETPDSHEVAAVRVRRDDESIIVDQPMTGRVFGVWPLAAAHEIGEAMLAKARELETKERADQVAYDQAILLRSGKPFGLTSDPVLQDEAGKLAAWDSSLRRYLPGGIRGLRGIHGQEQFGAPKLVRGRAPFTLQELTFLGKLRNQNGKL